MPGAPLLDNTFSLIEKLSLQTPLLEAWRNEGCGLNTRKDSSDRPPGATPKTHRPAEPRSREGWRNLAECKGFSTIHNRGAGQTVDDQRDGRSFARHRHSDHRAEELLLTLAIAIPGGGFRVKLDLERNEFEVSKPNKLEQSSKSGSTSPGTRSRDREDAPFSWWSSSSGELSTLERCREIQPVSGGPSTAIGDVVSAFKADPPESGC